MIRVLLFVVCCIAFTAIVRAEAPDVVGLSPSGGQRGTEATIHLVDSKGARRRGRKRREEAPKQEKIDPASVRLWSDVPGIELIEPDGDDAFKLKIGSEVPPGTHWLRFHTADGASGLRPFVVGTLGEAAEVEPNNTLAQAQALGETPMVTVNGVLDKGGEVDSFAVTLAAGQTLVAVLAAKQTLGSPMDGLLQVVDANGFVLEQNDDQRGFDPRVVFTAPKAGTYFVRTFAFPANPDTTIQYSGAGNYVYRLTLAAGPFLDRVLPSALTTGQPAKVRAAGWNLPADAGEIELPALAAGVQAVYRDGWESTAKALVTPWPVVMEVEPNPAATPQAIGVPGVLCGVIGEPKDVDAWKFAAQANQRVSIRLSALALGSALDALVRVFDAAGQKLSEVDDAVQDEADVVLEFTAPKEGEYVVAVTDRFAHGGPGYWYALSLAEPQPSALLQAAADAFVVKPDAPLEIPLTVERRHGYGLALKVGVEGLPDGVTAEPVVSEPEGDSSKAVKLIVKSARIEPWTGAIRIVGKAEGDAAPERVAQFKSPLTGDWLPHLWLTAAPK